MQRELLEEFFRPGDSLCRACAREAEKRNPAVKLARNIVAQPREAWAQRMLHSIGAL